MKKIGLVIMMIVLMATVANAASINGEFEGNPIIKMKSNGKTLAVEDVPAILYNGRTMVPIGMLRELGVGVVWDQKTQIVEVTINQPKIEPTVSSFDPIRATKEIISYGGGGLTLVDIGGKMTALTYFSSKNGFDGDWGNVDKIFRTMIGFDSIYSRVVYVEGNNESVLEIKTQTFKNFMDGKITQDELTDSWILTGPQFENTTTQSNGSIDTRNEETYPSTNTCSQMRDEYALKVFELENTISPFSGKDNYELRIYKETWEDSYNYLGCNY